MEYQFKGDWCHAGGVGNWEAIGHITTHPNYGWPHVIGCMYFHEEGIEVMTLNCIYCGREINDDEDVR